ncbi:MAG: tRNA guanosine(34) transglycosylase Tgt [Patescibacteria group bacterium]
MDFFTITGRDKNTKARTGILRTQHGGIAETPSYVVVGTRAKIKTLSSEDIKDSKTQIIISNTYHLFRELGSSIESFEGLHKRLGFDGVVMTDSGGFQVFSLGFSREHNVSKVGFFSHKKNSFIQDFLLALRAKFGLRNKKNSVRITNNGAWFIDESYGDKEPISLTPESSIHIQEQLGADIILAFDECTSPKHGYWYTKWAMNRTHRWAKRCIEAKKNKNQFLYGIVQGGDYEVLRNKSAEVIGDMPFDGFAIGGSFGKDDMRKVIDWSIPHLPEGKPRHLLGVGRIEDILDGVERGIDTFDCVIPTREGRHGGIWTMKGRYDVTKMKLMDVDEPLEIGCACPTCSEGITKGMLCKLFREKNMEAGRYATLHNVFFFNAFMERVREAIKNGAFSEFKKQTLSDLHLV